MLVTIGTDEVWAPPRMCGFELTEDCVLTNRNAVNWDIAAEGLLTRWAIRWPQGWAELSLEEPVLVDALHSPAIIRAGALRVQIQPPGRLLGRELPSAPGFPTLTE